MRIVNKDYKNTNYLFKYIRIKNRTKKPFQGNGSFGFHNLTTVDLEYFLMFYMFSDVSEL